MSKLKADEQEKLLSHRKDHKWVEQYTKDRWLNLGDTSKIEVVNPFSLRTREEIENPHIYLLDLMRRSENFGFTCRHLFEKNLAPFQLAILRELWQRPFPMLLGARGSGKSFLLAVYAMLRALFNQGARVVIVGAAFRQAKVVFDYCHDLWDKSPLLQDLVGGDKRNGPRRDVDMCRLRMGDSLIVALPLGTGEKIRGQRATHIISDEYASIPVDIFETVVRGFAAVSLDPVVKMQYEYRKQALKELQLWSPEQDEVEQGKLLSNQTIISGTAYYSFNHFYTYWRRYKAIIESKGDEEKLHEIFHGNIPNDFNWKDYSIIRLPVEKLPPGFMDSKQIAQAKATVHLGIYSMEYGSCQSPDVQVITDRGVKAIIDIKAGDMVLTHKGRFREVLKKTFREYNGMIQKWSTYGSNSVAKTTPEHPFWKGEEKWGTLPNVMLSGSTHFAALTQLSGRRRLDIRQYVSNWMEADSGALIYPRHSQSRFTREEVAYIRSSPLTQSELGRKFGVKPSTINIIVRRPKRPKNAIPATIALDYDFGLIVGWYASEGCRGANGRNSVFALDGHAESNLIGYVTQLCNACKKVFGFFPKTYHRESDSVTMVTVNQRLVSELLCAICPGVSHTKIIDPDVLFSNADFLKGFITGYWNGDGHTSSKQNNSQGGCVNEGLLTQVKLGLSFFGIGSSLFPVKTMKPAIFRGKEYPARQAYVLSIHGSNNRLFRKTFWGFDPDEPVIKHIGHIRYEEGVIHFDFKSVIEEPYNGYVYNLEVDEDNSYSLPNATVHNCFATDSNGFFKRSLIEGCVVGKPDNIIEHPSCTTTRFNAVLRGTPGRNYVMAIDPASETDNFSIIILECWPDHRRIVFSWTSNRQKYKAKMSRGLTTETDFYGYAARKIRDLLQVFNVQRIAIDSQGGGVAVTEALQDTNRLKDGERPIYPVIILDDPQPTDGMAGDHLLEIIQFAKADWVSAANHGMKKDFEDRCLLFPEFNPAVVGLSLEDDKATGRVVVDTEDRVTERLYDTLEDAVMEIEELKDELASIVYSQTGQSMRDRWDTPETKQAGGKKGRLRKDRYSALLMANMIGRTLQRAPQEEVYSPHGGFAHSLGKVKPDGRMWIGPAWWTESQSAGNYGAVVRRGVE